ncbi:MAG: type II secretion system GspH family protein [Microbacteriaceae bacterium]|nr:type II secretion system GspH family protein [Microbacteriaceae bacterium]MCL2796204.1 type II secretion system GspH family protein [Microbacteriaceae bacterium]
MKRLLQGEEGLGLIDVLVAMVLLGILAVAIIPALTLAMRVASNNVDVASASQIVDQELDKARAHLPTNCAALQYYASETIGLNEADPRGTVLSTHYEIEQPFVCPTIFPATVHFVVWVGKEGSSEHLAEGSVELQLTSAS